MNKTELIEIIAQQTGLSKTQAKSAVECYHDTVAGQLKKGGSIEISGFGSFSVAARAARTGRNPSTGAPLQIKASRVPKFRPGKALKDSVN